jgi:hypothetical protein
VLGYKRKRCNSNEWESISNLESDPPVEDAGVTEKQPKEGGWQQPEGRVDPALGWSWGEDGTPTWRSSRGRDGQGTRNLDLEPEEAAEMEDKEEEAADEPEPEEARPAVVTQVNDPEPEEACLTQAESIAEMEDKEEVAAETAQAKSTAEMKAKNKKAQAKSTAEMKAKKKKAQAKSTAEMKAKKNTAAQAESIAEMEAKKNKAAQAESIAEMETKKNKAAQAESIAEMEDKEEAAAETTVAPDEAAAEPANDTEATAEDAVSQAKSTAEMKAKKKKAQAKSNAEMKAKKKKAEPTVRESCSHLKFCIGPDCKSASKALIALREMGLEVHDVLDDGNCGHCCLLVGLAVLGFPKQANQKALRKHLQGKPEHC